MITAYAQAADRQGLDAAMDGRAVALENTAFVSMRDKSASLNLRGKPQLVGKVQVRCGQGIVRLELPGSEDDAESRSPIVVAIRDHELHANATVLAGRVVETISAIDRLCDQVAIEAAIGVADRLVHARRMRLKLEVVAAVALIAAGIAAILVARTAAGVSDV